MIPSGTVRSKRILIVEDDDDARELIGELIGELGHEVVPAASAREAVLEAERRPPDVAFIDLGLPGVDGCETARRIRGVVAGANIRLIALTGYSDDSTRARARAAGFDDFLVKPAHTTALEAAVNGPAA